MTGLGVSSLVDMAVETELAVELVFSTLLFRLLVVFLFIVEGLAHIVEVGFIIIVDQIQLVPKDNALMSDEFGGVIVVLLRYRLYHGLQN